MRIVRWITKAAETHSEYVTLIAFPPQRWLHELASMLRHKYIAYYYYFNMDVSCHRPFLPDTSLEPAVIRTVQASSFTLQYFPYYV